MAEYRLTPAALRDLENIWRYTHEHWNLEQAEKYLALIDSVFAKLAPAPKAALACDSVRSCYL